MASIDLKDEYVLVSVWEEHRKVFMDGCAV